MRGAVFMDTLKQTWWQMLYWGIGLGAIGIIVIVMIPLLDMQQIISLLETLPPVLLGALGVGSDLKLFASPEGFVAIGFFGKSALLFAVYPVVMGMRVTANEEDAGIMDVLITLPIQRFWFVVEKFAAYVVSVIFVVVMIYLGMNIGVAISGVKLNMQELSGVTFNLIPVLTLVLAFTMFIGTLVRRKPVALGIVTVFVIASYMIQTVSAMAQGPLGDAIGTISFFTYYNAGAILKDGLIWTHVVGLFVLALILLALSLQRFEHRDIGI